MTDKSVYPWPEEAVLEVIFVKTSRIPSVPEEVKSYRSGLHAFYAGVSLRKAPVEHREEWRRGWLQSQRAWKNVWKMLRRMGEYSAWPRARPGPKKAPPVHSITVERKLSF